MGRFRKYFTPEEAKIGRRDYSRKYRKTHRDKIRAYKKANRHRYLKWQSAYHPNYKLKSYGLTQETYAHMVSLQNNRCAICDQVMTRPHIDHDHTTKLVRALLCLPCNVALGHIENTQFLNKALSYLGGYNARLPITPQQSQHTEQKESERG